MALAAPVERDPLRLRVVPAAAVLAGSALALLPAVVTVPMWPPFGLLAALAWRLRRPELWPAWAALPLGLADDLLGGNALGSAAVLWTCAFLALDAADHRLLARDHWDDWQLAILALLFCAVGQWAFAWFTGGGGPLWVLAPQMALSVLLFPLVARLCAALDRWRLIR
jgi:rod shape-determining protein MreD